MASEKKRQDLDVYVVVDSTQKVLEKLNEGEYFFTENAALTFIQTEDSDDEYLWDVYRVCITREKSL